MANMSVSSSVYPFIIISFALRGGNALVEERRRKRRERERKKETGLAKTTIKLRNASGDRYDIVAAKRAIFHVA